MVPNSSDRNAACGPYMAPWNSRPPTTATTVSGKFLVSIRKTNTNDHTADPDRAEQIQRLAAEAVGQRAPDRDRHEVHRRADEHGVEHERAGRGVIRRVLGQVGDDDDGEDVVRDVLGEPGAHRGEDLARVLLEHLDDRHGDFTPPASVAAAACACCWACRKTGDSSMDSRMNKPISTSTADSRKGIRQPQDRNASSVWTSASTASSPLAISCPNGTPACGQLAQ